jgi:hypothetical protein
MEHIDARMDELATARGIVFDMRGYSAGNEQVLARLTDHPLRSAYFNIPQTVYPGPYAGTSSKLTGSATSSPRPRQPAATATSTSSRHRLVSGSQLR